MEKPDPTDLALVGCGLIIVGLYAWQVVETERRAKRMEVLYATAFGLSDGPAAPVVRLVKPDTPPADIPGAGPAPHDPVPVKPAVPPADA